MILKDLNRYFPLRKLLNLVLTMSVSIQLILVIYNHLTGFAVMTSFTHFAVRLVLGVIFSIAGGLAIAIPDLLVIRYLNRRFSWSRKPVIRLLIQFAMAVVIAVSITIVLTTLSHLLSAYPQGLAYIIFLNGLIVSVVNIIVMAILEALVFFNESNSARLKAESLEKELASTRFELLKNQINPHFMFNSLNVLSGLVEQDAAKAQQFIDEFAQIYRYVLETIEKTVVPLNDELGFVRSYIFLQQIRHGDAIRLTVNVDATLLTFVLPPLSLQLVLENAFKHNIVSISQPLFIEIADDGRSLIVSNNLQKKVSVGNSTGIGQKNLTRRYQMITDEIPHFSIVNNRYVVKLPLIDTDYDERTDH